VIITRFVAEEDAKQVRDDLERILVPALEDKNVKERELSVSEAKEMAIERHNKREDQVTKDGHFLASFLSGVLGIFFVPFYSLYAFLFVREIEARKKLTEDFKFVEEAEDQKANEFRKSWNKKLGSALVIGGLFFLAIIHNISPRLYRNSLNTVERVFEDGYEGRKELIQKIIDEHGKEIETE